MMKNLTISCRTAGSLLLFIAFGSFEGQQQKTAVQHLQKSSLKKTYVKLAPDPQLHASLFRAADEKDLQLKKDKANDIKKIEASGRGKPTLKAMLLATPNGVRGDKANAQQKKADQATAK